MTKNLFYGDGSRTRLNLSKPFLSGRLLGPKRKLSTNFHRRVFHKNIRILNFSKPNLKGTVQRSCSMKWSNAIIPPKMMKKTDERKLRGIIRWGGRLVSDWLRRVQGSRTRLQIVLGEDGGEVAEDWEINHFTIRRPILLWCELWEVFIDESWMGVSVDACSLLIILGWLFQCD